MADGKAKELVLCVRVKLLSGHKLVAKDWTSSDPYCRVWVAPKGLIETPERGWFASSVHPSTLNPTWGPKPKPSPQTKDLFKQLGKEFMTPLSDPNQDCWNFLWREGDVIHVQCWDHDYKGYQKDDYMGNVSFPLDLSVTGPQNVTEKVHNGPIGQLRSKSKVSGTITIEWEWLTKTDQLKIEKWIPLLKQITYEDERALSFLTQEDLLPHMSVSVARFVLGKIEKGEVSFPSRTLSFNSGNPNFKNRRQTIMTEAADWENEFADEEEDNEVREPDGQLFLMLGTKIISIEFFADETIYNVKFRLAEEAIVPTQSLSFTPENGGPVIHDDVSVLDYANATLRTACTAKPVTEIARQFTPPAPPPVPILPPVPQFGRANSLGQMPPPVPPRGDSYRRLPLPNGSVNPPPNYDITNIYQEQRQRNVGSFSAPNFAGSGGPGGEPSKPSRKKGGAPSIGSFTRENSFSSGLDASSKGLVPTISPRGPQRSNSNIRGSNPQRMRHVSPGVVRRTTSQSGSGGPHGEKTPGFVKRHTRQHSTGSGSGPRISKKMGLITEMANLVINQDFGKMVRVLQTLPMEDLVIVTPILVACTCAEIIGLIKTKVEESKHFATRVRMIQNTRVQFSHLNSVVGHQPLSTFLEKFLSPNLSFKQGDSWQISSVHPITNEPFDAVKVVKVFSSLARPSILVFSKDGESLTPGVLFKQGEDLYNETCLQVMFKFMNELWESLLPEDLRPKIFGLRELPGSVERGFLETVAEVRDLEIVERGNFDLITPENDEHFIRTSCGWILASYFLGLSDRHRENTLVRITDGSAIPIDFGFILGNQPPSYNTFCITVSGDMYKYLLRKGKWESFSLMFMAGFWAVRTKAQEFVKLAVHLFQGTDRNLETSARFITHRMRIGEDMSKAMRKTFGNLRHAPICFFTKKKIEGHAKSKKIPARDDFIGSLARKIGANAAKPNKAEEDTGGDVHTAKHLHPGKVALNLPDQYPPHYPGDFVALMVQVQNQAKKSKE